MAIIRNRRPRRPPSIFQRFLLAWPGEQRFGHYKFLPAFFVAGAALEYVMIKWNVGPVNFYNTFKTRKAEELLAAEKFPVIIVRKS